MMDMTDGGAVSRNGQSLNAFQKLMRCWKALAPYNAIQAIEIEGVANVPRWQDAGAEVCSKLVQANLMPPFPPPEPVEYVVEGSACIETMTRLINTPFVEHSSPVRFCIVQNPQSYHFILTYDHWFADSWSMRELMRCIYLQACRGTFDPQFTPPLRGDARPHWLQSCRQCLRQYLRHRRAARLNFTDPLDFSTGIAVKTLGADFISRIRAAARRRDVSVHDVFTAIIARLMGDLTQKERCKPRRFGHAPRDRVAIGSIVDIRKTLSATTSNPAAPDRSFGVELGFSTVIVRSPEDVPLDELIQEIHRQNAEQKRKSTPRASLAALNLTRFFWNLYREKRHHAHFFSKNMPLLAGISNVNLTDQWMCRSTDEPLRILDYFRISPVGPLLPLVWATTTFNDRLTVYLTYRHTALDGATAEALLEDFAGWLERLCE